MENIVIINSCNYGSTGKIAIGLNNYLNSGGKYKSQFIYARNEKNRDVTFNSKKIGTFPGVFLHYFLSKCLGVQGYGSIVNTYRVLRHIDTEKVDTVYIVSLRGYFINEKILYSALAKRKSRIVYVMIDEYPLFGECEYNHGCRLYENECKNCSRFESNAIQKALGMPHRKYKIKDAFYKADITFTAPEFVIRKAEKSPLLAGRDLRIVDEAIDVRAFSPKNTDSLRTKLNIKADQIVLVCIAPFSNVRKGCGYFLELAQKMSAEQQFVFVQVGFDVPLKKYKLPDNYRAIGYVEDQQMLAEYYSLADLFVFPSISDTMPNACLEALACGSPLLCFNISGMPFLGTPPIVTLAEPKNVEEMCRIVSGIGKKSDGTIAQCRDYAMERFDNVKYYQKLESIGNSRN